MVIPGPFSHSFLMMNDVRHCFGFSLTKSYASEKAWKSISEIMSSAKMGNGDI